MYSMDYARKIGVKVISITSTASAKDWIDTHSGMPSSINANPY